MGLSVVLPCYNEANSLARLIQGYHNAALRFGININSFELILVDNGSNDDTQNILKQISKDPNSSFVTSVTVKKNQGYGHGLLQGLQKVKFEVCAFSHADEQCAPQDVIKAYLIYLKNGRCLVKGKRKGRALFDRLFSLGFKWCVRILLRKDINEINAQPKLFPSSLIPALSQNAPLHFAFDLHVLLCALKHKLPIREFQVYFPPRVHGKSRWAATFSSKLRHIRLVLNYLFSVRA